MRFAHSFWEKPFSQKNFSSFSYNKTKSNMLYFLISALLVKKQGYEIDLYTSTDGAKSLDVDVYDNIYTILDNNDKLKNLDLKFWAVSKICAYDSKQWTKDTIHIDGDVFLYKDKVYDIIEASEDFDVIVQGIESGEHYNGITLTNKGKIYDHLLNAVPNCVWDNRITFNCGLVKFNNDNLRKKYVDNYFKLAKHLCRQVSFVKSNDEQFTPDLIIEQEFLYLISKNTKYKTIISDTDKFMQTRKDDETGYAHHTGIYKFEKDMINEQLDLLKTLDPVKHRKMYDMLNKKER